MKIDHQTIEALDAAGIQFIAFVRAPGGGQTILLKPPEVASFVKDPEQAAALSFGVSKSEYLDWVRTDGTPRCGAMAKSGKRCQRIISGRIQMPIEAWLQKDGGFCAVHGGRGSARAKGKKAKSRR
jgi:hypothetical protein